MWPGSQGSAMQSLGLLLAVAGLGHSAPQSLIILDTTTPASSATSTTLPTTTTTTYTTFPTTTSTTSTTTTEKPVAELPTEVTRFHVTSQIQLRYARTVVESTIMNPDPVAQLAQFAMTIPDSAFVSNFSMVVGGGEFVARVEGKEKAEETFQHAAIRGQAAGLVSQDSRDANRVTVAASLEGGQEIVFRLTYDELLERKEGMYEQAINIDLQQVVEDFRVEVSIHETLPITTVSVPELLESNEIDPTEDVDSSIAVIERGVGGDEQRARVVFAPSRAEQEAAGEQGVSGRLIVRYDVDRRGQDSEIQVIDGYFVHYFVPEQLETLSKHTIFILDVSGSMGGEKLQQLKDAMFTMLDALKPTDYFSIITFSSEVHHWTPNPNQETHPDEDGSSAADFVKELFVKMMLVKTKRPTPTHTMATEMNKKAAIQHVLDLQAGGGTNINDAVLAGLRVSHPQGMTSMIVFLTDGRGGTNGQVLKKNIAAANANLNRPIFSVAFGRGADFELLKAISVNTGSFAKRIYEGSDAALQLEHFYSQISSPLVTNIEFDYVGATVDNASLTDTSLRTFFRGGQYVVAGWCGTGRDMQVRVTGERSREAYSDTIDICLRSSEAEDRLAGGCIPHTPVPARSEAQEFMQNLYAFLNIKQLLTKDEKAKALSLALANNFVTPVTSLVVVQPGVEDRLAAVEDRANSDGLPSYTPPQGGFSRIVGGGGTQGYSASASPPGGFSLRSGSSASRRKTAYRPAGHNRRKERPSRPAGYPAPPPPAPRPAYAAPRPTAYAAPRPAYAAPRPAYAAPRPAYGAPQPIILAEEVALLKSTTTPAPPVTCTGSLTLYSSTFHRGEQVTLAEDSLDLAAFSDRAVSAEVSGTCCWAVHGEVEGRGPTTVLRPGGTYTGTDSFGRLLFREVSSVTRVHCFNAIF